MDLRTSTDKIILFLIPSKERFTELQNSPLLLSPATVVSLLFYSSVQELHLLPWTQTPPVYRSALCSAGVPLPTSLLTSVVMVGPGVPVRTGER